MDFNELFRNSANYTPGTMRGYKISQYFDKHKGVNAVTMLGLNAVGFPLLFIRPSEIHSRRIAANAALVVHAVLHSLGFEDAKIMGALGINNQPSIAITGAFASDCFGVDDK